MLINYVLKLFGSITVSCFILGTRPHPEHAEIGPYLWVWGLTMDVE